MFSPEYDDPANMGDEYGSQYGQYGAPYEQYESRASMAGRSIGIYKNYCYYAITYKHLSNVI
jgi:hypothetical protein